MEMEQIILKIEMETHKCFKTATLSPKSSYPFYMPYNTPIFCPYMFHIQKLSPSSTYLHIGNV